LIVPEATFSLHYPPTWCLARPFLCRS
jgi:hypothetical protein